MSVWLLGLCSDHSPCWYLELHLVLLVMQVLLAGAPNSFAPATHGSCSQAAPWQQKVGPLICQAAAYFALFAGRGRACCD